MQGRNEDVDHFLPDNVVKDTGQTVRELTLQTSNHHFGFQAVLSKQYGTILKVFQVENQRHFVVQIVEKEVETQVLQLLR